MIKLIAVLEVKPEFVATIEETAWPLVKGSRSEKGCISYNFVKTANSSNTFMFLEEWKDDEAIAIHNATEHFTTICPGLRDMCSNMTLYKVIM